MKPLPKEHLLKSVSYRNLLLFGTTIFLISASRMSLIAESYTDDNERSKAMGIAMGGYALGILGIQFWFLDSIVGINQVQMKSSSLLKLLVDPYIILCAGAIMITSMSLAVLESTVPIWVMDTMEAQQWQL
ncbi:chromaffin granule amine transporter-like, partial [Mercenaria mercenaria]|uniref:chromaffin granule amine transporter-like n=1 Tax=Mercenaria mercenaria TaxID=6596 RepID=UPI00234F1E29